MDQREFDNEVVLRAVYAYVKRTGSTGGFEPYSPEVAELSCFVMDIIKAERARVTICVGGPEDVGMLDRSVFDAAVEAVKLRAAGKIPPRPRSGE